MLTHAFEAGADDEKCVDNNIPKEEDTAPQIE